MTAKQKMIDTPANEIEPRPDGWERFEKAVDAALHTPPKHRSGTSNSKPTKREKD